MGEGYSTLLQRVAPMEAWANHQCGPTLRKLFGAYRAPDYWSCYRRFRAIDDGDGYLNYEELLQVIAMQEYNLLFLWDNFSQQNELMPSSELMTVISVFSSATLFEKAKFLLAVFDESHTGMNTGMEIARIMFNVLSVMAKCTGERIKQREVTAQLKGILPQLLPTYAEELEQKYMGKNDHCFTNARIIGQIELEKLLPAIQSTYEALPVAGPTPDGACLPPPPDWAETVGERRPPVKNQQPPPPDTAQGTVRLTKDDIAHLEWMSGMIDAEEEAGKENLIRNAQLAKSDAAAYSQEIQKAAEPTQRWMLIYGSDFSVVARNLTSFRILFIKSVSSALGLPQGCIEVENVSRGPGRAVVVAFVIHPAGRNGDTRDGADLAALLEQQLVLTHSALRRGAFKEYCASAELFEAAPDPMHWPPQPMEATMRTSPTASQHTKLAATVSDEPAPGPDPTEILSEMLAEAKSDLESMRRERDTLKKQLNDKGAGQKRSVRAESNEAVSGQQEAKALQEARAELEAMRKRAEAAERRAEAAERTPKAGQEAKAGQEPKALQEAKAELEAVRKRAEAAEKECESLNQYIEYMEDVSRSEKQTKGQTGDARSVGQGQASSSTAPAAREHAAPPPAVNEYAAPPAAVRGYATAAPIVTHELDF